MHVVFQLNGKVLIRIPITYEAGIKNISHFSKQTFGEDSLCTRNLLDAENIKQQKEKNAPAFLSLKG